MKRKTILRISSFIILILLFIIYAIILNMSCKIKIAEEYCNKENMIYSSLISHNTFTCKYNNTREYKPERYFNFLESEKQQCLLWK